GSLLARVRPVLRGPGARHDDRSLGRDQLEAGVAVAAPDHRDRARDRRDGGPARAPGAPPYAAGIFFDGSRNGSVTTRADVDPCGESTMSSVPGAASSMGTHA